MINLSDVDPIVVAMCSEPLYPDNAFLEIDRDDQPIRIASYVEHDPLARDDARRRIKPFDVSGARPPRFADLIEPSIERRLQRLLIPVPSTRLDELTERPPGDDSHVQEIVCAHFGYKVRR